ncbi:MAG: hypothetical protein ABI036_17295 [Fibrobacteria bacterium]
MIRINLLKPLEPQMAPFIFDEPGARSKRPLLVVGGLVLVAVIVIAVLQFPSMFGGLFAHEEKEAVVVPAPPIPASDQVPARPKTVTSQAVEETVKDVQDDHVKEQIAANYSGMVPSGKIEYQYYSSKRILKDIKAITPPDVGFANFIFTPPGDFYVHGLAVDEQNLERFRQGLAGLMGSDVKMGMNVPAGTHGKSKEFSFFVTVKYPLDDFPNPPNHVISKAGLQHDLKQLKTVAAALGIRLKEPRLFNTSQAGKNSKLIYQTSADCSFQQLQDLISELHEGNSNLGFIKFALHASGDEKVVTEMDILAYIQP